MRRAIALILLVVCLGPGTWWRTRPLPPGDDPVLRFIELPVPPPASLKSSLGSFVIENMWRMESRHRLFGGYSGLLALRNGQLLAVSDRASLLRFSPPGTRSGQPHFGRIQWKGHRRPPSWDVESVTADQARRTVWVGLEDRNEIARLELSVRGLSIDAVVAPPGMADWGGNSGPESLVRLKDGRFIVLREGFSDLIGRRLHAGQLFTGDPIEHQDVKRFALAGPAGFSPTDAAQMPDGRVLILFRRLNWPLPARFSIRIGMGDPDLIEPDRLWPVRQVAELPRSMPVDNFEGLAIEPRADGRLAVWLISDANGAAFQDTYLVNLSVDPADLPPPRRRSTRRQIREHR